MRESTFISRNPRYTLVTAFVVGLLVALALVEWGLRLFFPYTVATLGHQHAENAKFYGWGFDPAALGGRIRPP